MNDTKQETRHPLLDKEFSSIETWQKWLELWEATTDVEILEGLLHVGFDQRTDSPERVQVADRIIFYLHVADGHESASFKRPGDTYSPSPEYCKRLAKKAFAVLAQKLFKHAEDGEDGYTGLRWLTRDKRLLPEFLWWLRAGRFEGADNIYEFDHGNRSHHRDLAREFVLKLCKLAWGIDGRRTFSLQTDDTFISRLEAAQVDLLPALMELGALDILRSRRAQITDACLARLREMATKNVGGNPLTLEAALVSGSRIAEIVILHDIRRREEARQAAIAQAEADAREAQKRLESLKTKPQGN